MSRHAEPPQWKDWNVAITGINARPDNPGPGCAVARCLRHASGFRGRLIGLAYATLDAGTQILSADDALAAFADADVPTSLPRTAAKINPFLVDSGLTKSEAPIENLFDPSFTQAVVDGGS